MKHTVKSTLRNYAGGSLEGLRKTTTGENESTF